MNKQYRIGGFKDNNVTVCNVHVYLIACIRPSFVADRHTCKYSRTRSIICLHTGVNHTFVHVRTCTNTCTILTCTVHVCAYNVHVHCTCGLNMVQVGWNYDTLQFA